MKRSFAAIPPLGVHINTDTLPCGKRIRARARWTDPVSGIRKSRSIIVDNEASAYEFFSTLRSHVGADLDPFITLTDYADQIGDRFLRGVDMTPLPPDTGRAFGSEPYQHLGIYAFETSRPGWWTEASTAGRSSTLARRSRTRSLHSHGFSMRPFATRSSPEIR